MPQPSIGVDDASRDDEHLALAAAAGDADAFASLIERHYDRIHRLAWRWLGRSDGAEDVAELAASSE